MPFRRGPFLRRDPAADIGVLLRKLRETVRGMLEEMHQLCRRGHTPKVQRLQILQRLLSPGTLPARPDEGNRCGRYLRQAMEVEP